MNQYVKEFLHRGLIFGGFGPIILGIICAVAEPVLTGGELLLGIVSIYLLAFLQAGASVFNQIEGWSIPKSMLCHFAVLYAAYVGCYLVNRWIPFDWRVVVLFTAIFVVVYLAVWLTVFVCVKLTSRKLNAKIG
ncbi:MAG: DUF3021 domain-containing protein [Oscillospiraceae bacterium]|nr:DUF3021 domain-containing protein [Oscillospiraceae bacterium]